MSRWSHDGQTDHQHHAAVGSRVNPGNFSVMVTRQDSITIRSDFSRQTERDVLTLPALACDPKRLTVR